MRKIRNLVIGGIENKVLNLILVTVIILAAAFFSVTAYNSSMLAKLTEQTNQKQLDAITSSTAEMIDQVVDGTMARTTRRALRTCWMRQRASTASCAWRAASS